MLRSKFTYFLFFVFVCTKIFSQTSFNNGWINYNLKYYKIKIARDSLYKLDSAALVNAGIPLLNPQYIRLFQKGKELYPYIAGEADSALNTNDYILFYAEKNSGEDDSLLYYITPDAPYLTNPYYSVINDTGAVFLTYDSSLSVNKRLTLNTDTTYSSYTSSPYYIKQVFSPQADYFTGPFNAVNQNDPRYVTGEGWVSTYDNGVSPGTGYSFSFNTQSAYTSSVFLPQAVVCLSGGNDIAGVSPDHLFNVSYQGNAGMQTLGSYSLNAYDNNRLVFNLNPSTFNNGNTTISINSQTNPLTSITDYVAVNYISVTYPQKFDMLNQTAEKIYLPDDASQSQSKLSVSNFNNQSSQAILIDNNNHKISFLNASLTFNALVPNSGGTNFCYLTSWANIPAANTLRINAVNGNGLFVDYLSVGNLDSAFVIVSHPKLMNAPATGVTQYANWRHSGSNGGNYNVVTASILDLYDQFAYGVELHPSAIRNFCAYLINNASFTGIRPPSNLFLMGKGVHAMEAMPKIQISSWGFNVAAPQVFAKCLVPSWGNPSNDVLFTVGLPGSSIFPEPAIPTGRLAAQSDQDVLNYLSKAQLYSDQPADSLWRKRAIHFVGGSTPSDQANFASYMSGYKHIYEQPNIGGEVFTFLKLSSDPITTNTNDSIRLLINQGVSLMTFFGHGSPTGFDQNIDAPTAYNSAPHIPFILANSCFTGDIFSVQETTNSEEWILAPNDKGAIGYVATTAEGVVSALAPYTNELYKQFTYKNYGMPYGYCIQQAIKNVMGLGGSIDSVYQVDICMEMTLHGDPAIKANTVQKPDYAITNADLIFDTQTYPTDSIGLKIVMTNTGKAVAGNYSVKVMRVFPAGDTTIVYKNIAAPYFKDTLHFFMYENYTQAVGVNNFYVTINYLPSILTEENNDYANNVIGPVALFIRGSDIEPVWPYQYAIVPNLQKVNLKASTADAFAPMTTYHFQLDTSASFNSPVLTNTLITSVGGVVTANNISLLNIDSVVYYWRVAKDTVVNPNWKQSSFQVLTGKYGWAQAHFFQFNHDGYQYVKRDSIHRQYNFVRDLNTINVNTGIFKGYPLSTGEPDYYQTQFYLNNQQARLWSCGVDGWVVGVFNPVTGNLVPSYSVSIAPNSTPGALTWIGSNGNCICDSYNDRSTYDFGHENQCGDATDWRPNLANLLDTLKPGTPVIAYTVKASYGGTVQLPVTPQLSAAFHSIGSNQIDNLQDTSSLIIFGKKGMSVGQAHEVLSDSTYQLISLVDTFSTNFDIGYIASELIGPAQHTDTAWKSLHWHYKSLDADPTKDSIVVQLIGIDSTGLKTVLANFTDTSLDVTNLSYYASGKKYPYLQLIAQEADNTYHTPPQLTRWQVYFDQVPEAALFPAGGYSLVNSSLNEGDNLQLKMPIKNISEFPFKDSLLVTYYVQDANRNNHVLPSKLKRRPFLPDSVLIDTISVSTMGYAGANFFGIDVNPLNNVKHQLEQYHFNNIAQIAFNVAKDKINPILDVTFDGTHILNGDIVSAKPDILMSLKDENKFLALNDTGNFMLYVTAANSTTQQRVYFNNPQVQFTPAVLPNNSCKINYKPALVQDGLYTFDVKASDRSSNASGQFDYKVQFEVVNKPMITEVLNYPNPFSTSTKFVFTITGTEVPDALKIEVMTITGKVVKEITKEELGYLHVGRNITEYTWDGKDEYGGKLANGVYFYRVATRLNGKELDHMNTSADEYFKKGIGKMVIMR